MSLSETVGKLLDYRNTHKLSHRRLGSFVRAGLCARIALWHHQAEDLLWLVQLDEPIIKLDGAVSCMLVGTVPGTGR
jgi:hypothetical protein